MKLTTKTVIKIFNNLTKTESCQYKSLGSNTAPKLVSKFFDGLWWRGCKCTSYRSFRFYIISCDFARTYIKKYKIKQFYYYEKLSFRYATLLNILNPMSINTNYVTWGTPFITVSNCSNIKICYFHKCTYFS